MGSIPIYEGGGLVVRAIDTADGGISITGHDLSADEEYEYAVDVAATDVPILAAALGVDIGAPLMLALLSHAKEIVTTGEREWLASHGIASELFTWGLPPMMQPRVPRRREDFTVRWSPEGLVLLATYGRITWGPKGEPLFGRYYRWDGRARRWVRCAARDTVTCRDEDAIDVVDRSALDGWGASEAMGVPLPKPDADDLALLAEAIAAWAHTGQADKSGVEYIEHPRAVAATFDAVEDSIAHCAAWLHDVLEDTEMSADDLLSAGIPASVIDVVTELTRRPEIPPDAYYATIREDPVALRVKLADIEHNTDPTRIARLEPQDRARLAAKYAHALEQLLVAAAGPQIAGPSSGS